MFKYIRFIACSIFLFSFICESVAKEDKIKFSKYIVYEGEVEDKQPHQYGVLYCMNPEDKDSYLMKIEGKFSDNLIRNAKITTTGCNGFAFEGTLKYSIDKEDKDNPCLSLVLGQMKLSTLSLDNIRINSSTLPSVLVRDLAVSFIFNKSSKNWSMRFGENKEDNTNALVILEGVDFPSHIKKFGYDEKYLKGVKANVNISRQGITLADRACTFIFDDTSTYCYPDLSFSSDASKGKFFADEKTWHGTRILKDGSSVTKNENNEVCAVKFSKGKYASYEGTLFTNTMDLAALLGRNASSIDSTLFNNGTSVDNNGKPELWFSGESFTSRHLRWLKKYDADLVDSLENDIMTEKRAVEVMKYRVFLSDSLETVKRKELLLSRWNAEDVAMLEGTVTDLQRTDVLTKTGLASKYFSGKLELMLNVNKNVLFTVKINPSTEAYKEGLQIDKLCGELSKEYKGLWKIVDNKILIDDKDVGLSMSDDGKTITYDGVYGGKIPSKTEEKPASPKADQKSAQKPVQKQKQKSKKK